MGAVRRSQLPAKATRRRGGCSLSQNHRDLNLALPAQHLKGDLIAVTAHLEIDARRAEPQVTQDDLVEERRQPRIAQPDRARGGVEFETEGRLDQRERRRTRPSLRRTRDRIERRPPAALALEAAEQLGQAAQIHVARRIEQAFEHLRDRALVAIARKPERDQRVVVRPDRAVVIRHRIVARLAARDRTDAPAREEARAEQSVRDALRAIGPRDAGEQHLARVGCAHAARLLRAVERESVTFKLRAPERGLEFLCKARRLRLEHSSLLIATEPARATYPRAL